MSLSSLYLTTAPSTLMASSLLWHSACLSLSPRPPMCCICSTQPAATEPAPAPAPVPPPPPTSAPLPGSASTLPSNRALRALLEARKPLRPSHLFRGASAGSSSGRTQSLDLRLCSREARSVIQAPRLQVPLTSLRVLSMKAAAWGGRAWSRATTGKAAMVAARLEVRSMASARAQRVREAGPEEKGGACSCAVQAAPKGGEGRSTSPALPASSSCSRGLLLSTGPLPS